MRILGAGVLALVISMGCGGSKAPATAPPADTAIPAEPAPPVEPVAPAEPAAAADADAAAAAAEKPVADKPAADKPVADKPAEKAAPAGGAATASGYQLKVLPATWSKDQVKTYMKKVVAAGLGVQCDFCHDTDDFAADTNEHKLVARRMIAMTAELNKQHFKGEPRLACITCHNGKKEPKHD